MWIIEDVQSSIMHKVGSRANTLERDPCSMTLTINVDGREGVWFIDVPNTTTVIMLKNQLRYRDITNRSCNEIDIFFNNQKLANKYWYLRDYRIENFSNLVVKHRKNVIEQKEPPEPMLIKLGDAERKALIKQRLTSRRLEDIFAFAVLHALYDPNSSESSYFPSEVADLGAFKTATERLKSTSAPSSLYPFSPETKHKTKSSAQYKFFNEDEKSSKSSSKLNYKEHEDRSTSRQLTFTADSRYREMSKKGVISSRSHRPDVQTSLRKKPSGSKAYSFHPLGDDVKTKPEASELLRLKALSSQQSPECLVLGDSSAVTNYNRDSEITITSASQSSRKHRTKIRPGRINQKYKGPSSDIKFGQFDSKPPSFKRPKVISL